MIQLTDLTKLSRRPSRCSTTVEFVEGNNRRPWLVFGEGHLRQRNDRHDGRWWVHAYLGNATDFEHDTASLLRLPLIGVNIDGVSYHETKLTAWVDPGEDPTGDFSDFHVPRPGYNPLKHKDTVKCTTCKGRDQHVIVPEGFYVPPFDADLYQAVKGRRVQITFGVK